MNIYDIAKNCGVSTATVSRAINSPNKVKEVTRKKIFDYMNKHNYKLNPLAQKLAGNGSLGLIGIVCADISDIYFSQAVAFLQEKLSMQGYEILITASGYSMEQRENAIRNCFSRHVDAIVLIGSVFIESNTDFFNGIAKDIPLFFINGRLDTPNTYCVLCDDFEAMYLTAKNIQEEKIVYLYDSETYSSLMKLNGLKKAFAETGKQLSTKMLKLNDLSLVELTATCVELLKNQHFDCILTASDNLAVAALKASQELGLSIPDQIKILGYNNSILSKCTTPALSSINSQITLLAQRTYDNIISFFNGETPPTVQFVEGTLVHRETF